MPDSPIHIYEPYIATNQRKYLLDCINTNQIGQGKYIHEYETALQNYLGTKHVITTSNGSVSLQLILYALSISYGDEVITTSLTYAATISSINILGAKAVLIDSDDNLQMDLNEIEDAITCKTKAVMIPQLYSDSPDMGKLVSICKKHELHLIEDSAESFGCSFAEKKIGTFGIASSFSTFANKTLTTFEGGFIATDDDVLAAKLRLLRGQSHIGNFVHDGPGFNARLTNFQCAIGLAQLEDIGSIIARKKEIANYYRMHLCSDIEKIVPRIDSSAEWMPVFLLPEGLSYSEFQQRLVSFGVDVRPVFTPVHLMSGFNIDMSSMMLGGCVLYSRGFNLPSYPDLTELQLERVCEAVNKVVGERKI